MIAEIPDVGAARLRLDTLIRLRWLAIGGQAAAILFVAFVLDFPLPITEALGVILLAAALNIALSLGFPDNHRFGSAISALLLGFDILQLAVLLYLTGGLQNPFALLFLAPVMISAAALEPRHTLMLGVFAVLLASLLAMVHRPLPWVEGQELIFPPVYVGGIWTSILLGLGFIGVYSWRVAEEARQLARALAATELVLERETHLTALDGLAAAAAHQLGTPLATIAVVAKEMQRQLPAGSALREDADLLRQEAGRCRDILAKLASLGGDAGGPLGRHTLAALLDEVAAPHRNFGIDIAIDAAGEGPEPTIPRNPGLLYGLGNLIENAVDFATSRVRLDARWTGQHLSIAIEDDGPGFPPDVLQRLGEPYLTTRGAHVPREDAGRRHEGGGLGLGTFIAKTLLERSGGEVTWSNIPGQSGARTTIRWPRPAFERAGAAATGG